MKKRTIDPNAILSVCAILIAFISICISVWEGMETRRHNRLSVRPKLELSFNAGKDNFGYNVVNNGLGPAVITGLTIRVDGQKADYSGYLDDILAKMNLQGRLLKKSAIDSGSTIISGGNAAIFICKFQDNDDRETILKSVYSRISIQLNYASMYDEPFSCTIPKRTE
jgi:hypothetical protein